MGGQSHPELFQTSKLVRVQRLGQGHMDAVRTYTSQLQDGPVNNQAALLLPQQAEGLTADLEDTSVCQHGGRVAPSQLG